MMWTWDWFPKYTGSSCNSRDFLVAQMVKDPPATWETWFIPWVGKIPWRRAWQPPPVFLPEESPWTGGPGGLHTIGSQKVRRDWATHTLSHSAYLSLKWEMQEKEMATHSSILAWISPWIEEPGRLQSMGSQRVGHNWATDLNYRLYKHENSGDEIMYIGRFCLPVIMPAFRAINYLLLSCLVQAL